jgi:hypothetical protein
MKKRLHESTPSSSTSGLSFSTASSGIPGVGYLSGKAVKWVGVKILSSLEAVEIRRRIWLIRRLIKRASQIPEDQLVPWLMTRNCAVTRTIEDLFELTSYIACHLGSTQFADYLSGF